MKQRSTFVISDPEYTKPENFDIGPDSLRIKSIAAAREDRVTVPSQELPSELLPILQECSELHVRWVSGNPYSSIDPYGSRLPAGLHVFVKPLRETIP